MFLCPSILPCEYIYLPQYKFVHFCNQRLVNFCDICILVFKSLITVLSLFILRYINLIYFHYPLNSFVSVNLYHEVASLNCNRKGEGQEEFS